MESSRLCPPRCAGAELVTPGAEQGVEPRGIRPPQALTEDDEEPDHKSHDGEDQPPVADGVIIWGGESREVSAQPSPAQPEAQSPWNSGGGCPCPWPSPSLPGTRTHRS